MRRWLLAGWLASALVLLIVAIGFGVTTRTKGLADERSALAQQAAVQSHVLDGYFTHASALIALTARNPSFVDYYSMPGTQAQRARSSGVTMERVVDALTYLGRMYPDETGQASFIDNSGAENVRVVAGQQVQPENLATDVRDTGYFTPTLALPHGVVYQSRPYLSKILDDWVVSSGTQVFMPDRVKHAMVQFEVPIAAIRRLSANATRQQALIIDADTGAVVLDVSGAEPDQSGDSPDRRFRTLTGGWGHEGIVTVDGRQAAYHRVPTEVGNANRWYAVTVSAESITTFGGMGGFPVAVAMFCLMVIAYLVSALFRAQSVLLSAANTDPLTRLRNRRQLAADLQSMVPRATSDRPLLLMVSDLNGFKAYNDTYGHPEGDELLIRLAHALSTAVRGWGRAYRIGGDEFCVLAEPALDDIDERIGAVVRALRDDQQTVMITASIGAILLPDEATDGNEAMRLADRRMYGQKRNRRASDPPAPEYTGPFSSCPPVQRHSGE